MKYMILIHSNPQLWESLPKEEADRVLNNHYKIIDEMKGTGELIRVEGLGWDQTFVQFEPANRRSPRYCLATDVRVGRCRAGGDAAA